MRRIRAAIGETARDANSAARLPLRAQTAAGHVGTESPSNLANCSSLRILVPHFTPWAAGGKRAISTVSIAHEVSGLGSTRVVRFSVPKGSGDDGTGTVATGPENAEVQGRFEPLGAAGAVGNGRGGDSGGVGAAISALPAALRGRRAPRAAGQAPGQGLGQAGAGRRDRMDARRVPDRI